MNKERQMDGSEPAPRLGCGQESLDQVANDSQTLSSDVRELIRLEHALRQENDALRRQLAERSAEMQALAEEVKRAALAKDAFLAAVSHELRTPLTGLVTISEILQDEDSLGALTPRQRQHISVMQASGERLLATINGILRYTSLIAGATAIEREPCSLAGLCSGALRAVQAQAERKQLRLAHSVDPGDLEMESDAQAIRHILITLLENAIKFTPAHGLVYVAIARTSEDAVRITVADSGIGISTQDLPHLFQAFEQLDKRLARRFEGLGIGLAYVQELVGRLGGSIAVESTPGAGSSFHVLLPLRLPLAGPSPGRA